LIDYEHLNVAAPKMAFDLPTDARRLVQKASGYHATVKSGEVIFRDGEPTGKLPGNLLRGPQGLNQ